MKGRRNKKILLYIVGFVLMALIFSKVTHYLVYRDTPDFVLQAYEELKGDGRVIQMIGQVYDYEYTYNVNDLDRDTIPFFITVWGDKQDKLQYECKAVR